MKRNRRKTCSCVWMCKKENLNGSLLWKGGTCSGLPETVDDTFIFGYRCCMKKNGIKRDTPSIPPSEEKKLHEKPAP
ncbi:hypothetical protein CK203_011748 [Vitis vinifera]|uniref:Uncharacterized protein n=1 Tax=Vitis vinifera TaxID=29760 RepID=A0A438JU05_VITVI|nr:hypothetical protein CK203_011748 [Vitis vinifera]